MKEGFKEDDFIKVIDNKVKSWTGTKWENYLRPSTLFNAEKFEGYLNERVVDGNAGGTKRNAPKFTKEYYDDPY